MSFSYDVKKELSENIDKTRHCKIAELVAITSRIGEYHVLPGGRLAISFQSENLLVISALWKIIKKLYHTSAEVRVTTSPMWKTGAIYSVYVSDMSSQSEPELASRMLSDMGLLKKNGALFDLSLSHADLIPENICCKRAFLKGMFLCCGTVSDPKRSYHLEFSCMTPDRAGDVQSLLKQLGVSTSLVRRKNRYLVYVKDGDRVSTILGLVGATSGLLDFENTRILRDIGGNVNRRVNCETANMNKVISSGLRQVEQIKYIEKKAGLDSLPQELKEVAILRLENHDVGLKELGEMLTKPLGKSGINHRLARIKQIAEELGYK